VTKDDVVAEVARRLGETSADFQVLLGTIFDRVLDELASHDCIRSLWRTATFSFVANQRTYSTRTISGLASPHYPRDFKRIIVPAWGPVEGYIVRVKEESFVQFRLGSTDTDGANVTGRPRVWCLTPNEQTMAFDPAPGADDVLANGVEALFLVPPNALAGTSPIEEVRQEHIPAIIGGMIKHGLVFQEETLVDRPGAIRDYELMIIHMRGEAQRERGRATRMAFRDY
jgi:hypothetical protein